jgi:hypothetical protein
MNHSELIQLTDVLLKSFGAFLLGAITLFVRTHVKNKTAADAMVSLANLAGHVAAQLEQTVVVDLKVKGGWNPDTAKAIKTDALSLLRKTGEQFIAKLGIDPAHEATESLLGMLVESAVQKLRVPTSNPAVPQPAIPIKA